MNCKDRKRKMKWERTKVSVSMNPSLHKQVSVTKHKTENTTEFSSHRINLGPHSRYVNPTASRPRFLLRYYVYIPFSHCVSPMNDILHEARQCIIHHINLIRPVLVSGKPVSCHVRVLLSSKTQCCAQSFFSENVRKSTAPWWLYNSSATPNTDYTEVTPQLQVCVHSP